MVRRQPPSTEPLTGELVVRNGPDRGVSRVLLVPVTLVGSGESCDLRILDLTVRPVHCVVAVTPEGPLLRSVGGTTPVNGLPSSSRLLRSGDVLTVGPVELEVHWSLPPGPETGSSALLMRPQSLPTVNGDAAASSEQTRKSAAWRQQLAAGRVGLLQARAELLADFDRQLRDVAAARKEAEQLRTSAAADRTSFLALRRRAIRRWKRRKTRLTAAANRLAVEREALDTAAARFAIDRTAFDADRDRLTADHDDCRNRCAALETELHDRRADLDRRTADLESRAIALHAERTTFDGRRDGLLAEIDGLEARVRHLREGLSAVSNFAPTAVPLADVPDLADRRDTVERVADELADQRQALAEQVRRLTEAAAGWPVAERAAVTELESIALDLAASEAEFSQRSGALNASLAAAKVRHALLLDQEYYTERRSAEVAARETRADRRARARARLTRLWAARRQRESEGVRAALELAQLLRGKAAAIVATHAAVEDELRARATRLDRETLALDRARADFLAVTPSSVTGLVRAERRIEAAHARAASETAHHAEEVRAEMAAVESLFQQTTARLVELARREQDLAERAIDADLRKAEDREAEADRAAESFCRQGELAQAERQVERLQAELQRLTASLEQLSSPPASLRAA